jgi:hypothetical protein
MPAENVVKTISYPAWIRTMNEGTKIPSVTVTPPGIIEGIAQEGISSLLRLLPIIFSLPADGKRSL